MEQIIIEPLQQEELTDGASILASAMCPNPIHMAVFNWQHEKERDLQIGFFKAGLGRLQAGTLLAKQEGKIVGIMCYIRSPSCRMTPSQAQQLLPVLQSMFGGRTPRIMEWRSAWARHDPDEPHWHFGPFGVLPEKQGRGIGTQLLSRFCQHVDDLGEAAYLETEKIENLPLYQRFGFVMTEEETVLGVPCWFMWRSPQLKKTG
ncbi:MAG: GNAT family N-acetyltransferase [Dehalococcoidales bacterium]|nr:GNAT family N-acetyltransferase [Dehalococcoidales bacterium]